MSLNLLTTIDTKEVSQDFFRLLDEREKKTKDDMKKFLDKTNLSSEDKTKRYAEFSSNLYAISIQNGLASAIQFVIEDKRLDLQDKANKAQIDLTNAQKALATTQELTAQQELKLAEEKVKLAQQELELNKARMYLENAKAMVQFDNTIAQTLTEARKNGSDVTKSDRTYTCPVTDMVVSFEHISLAVVNALDMTRGILGLQMKQLDKQAESFGHHTLLQAGNQVMQLASSAISEGLTSIGGLLTTHKNIIDELSDGITDGNYGQIN